MNISEFSLNELKDELMKRLPSKEDVRFTPLEVKTWIKEHTKSSIKGTIVVIAVVAFLIYFVITPMLKTNELVIESNSTQLENVVEKKTVTVHVLGCVKNPGVYSLQESARIVDAINAAGGFTEDADQSSINLAAQISDAMQINVRANNNQGSVQTSGGSGGSNTSTSFPININTASAEQLTLLPGIGSSTAQKIISDRVANGRYAKKEDLKRVSGIGDKKYEAISDLICV